jgi:hypothetical protein
MANGVEFIWQRSPGPAVAHGDAVVTPYARTLGVRWPGGGWVWSFPVAVESVTGETVEKQLIVDSTRVLLLALWFGTVLAVWSARRSRRK